MPAPLMHPQWSWKAMVASKNIYPNSPSHAVMDVRGNRKESEMLPPRKTLVTSNHTRMCLMMKHVSLMNFCTFDDAQDKTVNCCGTSLKTSRISRNLKTPPYNLKSVKPKVARLPTTSEGPASQRMETSNGASITVLSLYQFMILHLSGVVQLILFLCIFLNMDAVQLLM
ncbi:hypothetical protein J3A83DRAFT_4213217, partial [Scleroderma citrinum]